MEQHTIVVYTKRNCRNCLGTGKSIGLHALCGEMVCSCVTEQLQIITTEKDYAIPTADRYIPGQAEYVLETTIARREADKYKSKEGKQG